MPFDKAEIHVVRSQEDDHCDQLQVNHACHKPAEKTDVPLSGVEKSEEQWV